MPEYTRPQVQEGSWFKVTGGGNVAYFPATKSYNLKSAPDDAQQIEKVEGFGARMTGELPSTDTDWTVFRTRNDARAHLALTFNLCPSCLNELVTIDGKATCSGDHDLA